MNRREFVKASVAATLATSMEARGQEKRKRKQPNILYVFGDQHRAQSLPGEPFSQVIAPNIDSFRRQNFSMDTCVSNYPLCTPYRGILMSGMWPSQSGIMFNNRVLSMQSGALGQTFRKAGYTTAYVGKWHLGGHGEAPGFIPSGPGRLGFEDYWQAWDSTNLHFHAWTYNPETGEKIFPQGWQPTRMTDQAVDFIKKQPSEKPWMLVLSWNPPHPPYNPPAEDMNLYPEDRLKYRPNVKLRPVSEDAKESSHFLATKEQLSNAMQGYYGAITGIDKEFDRLLKVLDETGQTEDTIVIFTSDHGDMMGSQGRMMKQVPYEESARVPFIIRYPGITPKDGASDMLFAAVDIYPTLCGLAGIPVPAHCVGRDFSPVMRGGKIQETEMVFLMNEVTPDDNGSGVFPKGGEGSAHTDKWVNQPSYRGVRTKTHTYAVTLTGRWLLFDNVADPYQMKNLVNDPASRPLMDKLDASVMAWLKSAKDDFPYKENIKRISSFPS